MIQEVEVIFLIIQDPGKTGLTQFLLLFLGKLLQNVNLVLQVPSIADSAHVLKGLYGDLLSIEQFENSYVEFNSLSF